jgi:hypothetical protein
MTRKFSLSLLLGLLLVSPQLSAGGESRYPILDSKVPVDEQTHPVWLNNSQVIFMGYELDPANPPKQIGLAWEIPRGVYVWDLQKGTAARDHSWDGTTNWCVSGEYRSFHRLRSGRDKTYDLVQGKVGEEQIQSLPAKHWFNKSSCHHYDATPEWVDEHRVRRALLEEHGYLDFGPWANADRSDDAKILFYRHNEKEPLKLPLNPNLTFNLFDYVGFENAYLLRGKANTPEAVPVWLLKPDGAVLTILDPKKEPWERIGWGHYFLTKRGLFLTGGRGDYGSVGTRGAYLLRKGGKIPVRLIAGSIQNAAVSPDGCKVAFVHFLHDQAGADSVKALREGKLGTRTLQMVDLCKGD